MAQNSSLDLSVVRQQILKQARQEEIQTDALKTFVTTNQLAVHRFDSEYCIGSNPTAIGVIQIFGNRVGKIAALDLEAYLTLDAANNWQLTGMDISCEHLGATRQVVEILMQFGTEFLNTPLGNNPETSMALAERLASFVHKLISWSDTY